MPSPCYTEWQSIIVLDYPHSYMHSLVSLSSMYMMSCPISKWASIRKKIEKDWSYPSDVLACSMFCSSPLISVLFSPAFILFLLWKFLFTNRFFFLQFILSHKMYIWQLFLIPLAGPRMLKPSCSFCLSTMIPNITLLKGKIRLSRPKSENVFFFLISTTIMFSLFVNLRLSLHISSLLSASSPFFFRTQSLFLYILLSVKLFLKVFKNFLEWGLGSNANQGKGSIRLKMYLL